MNKSSYTYVLQLLTVCRKQKIPFVAYRLPLEEELTIYIQHHSLPRKFSSIDDIVQKEGFIIAPFASSQCDSVFLIEPDCTIRTDEKDSEILHQLDKNNNFLNLETPSAHNVFSTTKKEFCTLVEDAKIAIKNGEIQKVVISKIRKERLASDFNAIAFFLTLCDSYPNTFVSMTQVPELGCWIGASPEMLLSANEKCVYTESIAGTQLAIDTHIENYIWGKKELEEQSIVTHYIEKTLQTKGILNYSMVGPTNYQAANLIHLKTSFEFEVSNINLLSTLLKALYPTPSVGGMPKEKALTFILSHEKHDRQLYAGYFGVLNIEKKTNLYVNIRCLQLFDEEYVLYSGAGITADSVAENEWEETENKMMTLRTVMNRT